MPSLRRKRPSTPETLALGSMDDFPGPCLREAPKPKRRRMPAGWTPDRPFDYLIIQENFWWGTRYFEKWSHVRANDPLANKLLYESPELVHVVRLSDFNSPKEG
jgi:hypothetical protein